MLRPNTPYRGVKQLTPKNQGIKKTTQQRLDHIISRANAQLENALYVDGITFLHWSYNQGYNACTCTLDAPITKETNTLFGGQVPEETTSKIKSRVTSKALKTNSLFDTSVLDSINAASEQAMSDFTSLLEDEGDITASEIEDIINNADNAASLVGGNRRCPICLGTGYTDSYSLTHGKRLILDASGFYPVKPIGSVILENNRPAEFVSDMHKENGVVWELRVPSYFRQVVNPRVYNGRYPNTDSFLFIKEKGTDTWEPFSLERYKGKTVLIMACPSRTETGRLWKITHVELNIQMADWILGQFPQIQQMSSIVAASYQETSVVLSAKLAQLSKGDVLLDSKYNNMWLVNDFSTSETTDRMTLGWQGNVRIIQDREILSILKVIKQPSFNVPHSGFAQWQKGQDRFYDKSSFGKPK